MLRGVKDKNMFIACTSPSPDELRSCDAGLYYYAIAGEVRSKLQVCPGII